MKKRLPYIIAAVILFFAEVIIGVYIKDDFIRPYGGDILITMLLCCIVRAVYPHKPKFLALYVFAVATMVETVQATPLPELIANGSKLLLTLMGSSFSYWDILCYAVGCLLFAAAEWVCIHRTAAARE